MLATFDDDDDDDGCRGVGFVFLVMRSWTSGTKE